jgi:hypothetical protein
MSGYSFARPVMIRNTISSGRAVILITAIGAGVGGGMDSQCDGQRCRQSARCPERFCSDLLSGGRYRDAIGECPLLRLISRKARRTMTRIYRRVPGCAGLAGRRNARCEARAAFVASRSDWFE